MIRNIKKLIKIISLPDTSNIREAMHVIDQGARGLALLIDPKTKCFVGLITDGDIRRALLNGYGLNSSISSLQKSEPKTAHINTASKEIRSMFSDKIKAIPLLNDDNQIIDIAFFDKQVRIPIANPTFLGNELTYVTECILSGWVSSAGEFVTNFEKMFAKFCGTKYAIATSNGTTALHLALLAYNIGIGDEVIVPTLSFIATANAVTYTGAKPVFVDSELETWNINPNLIEQAITEKTKAIIPVHLYGHPANLDPILKIAKRHGLAVIEDAAEAHGALYKGRRVGSIGNIGTFSFYGNKMITTGEGGMVVTNQESIAKKVRILHDHGMNPKKRYWHNILGYNYRMTNIQAALGVAQMERINNLLIKKKKIASNYIEKLKDIPGIKLPPKATYADNVYWLFSVLINPQIFGMTRDKLMVKLREKNIETRPLFPPIHLQPIYNTKQSFPIAEYLSKNGLSLPSAVTLSNKDILRIVDIISDSSHS